MNRFRSKMAVSILAVFSVMVTLGAFVDAWADAGTPGFTPFKTTYSVKCSATPAFRSKVDYGFYVVPGQTQKWYTQRYAFVNTGADIVNAEVYIVNKWNSSSSTWHWLQKNPKWAGPDRAFDQYTLGNNPIPVFKGTLKKNVTYHFHITNPLGNLINVNNVPEWINPYQVCFVLDKTNDSKLKLDCVTVTTMPKLNF